jgi:hypothetical protein
LKLAVWKPATDMAILLGLCPHPHHHCQNIFMDMDPPPPVCGALMVFLMTALLVIHPCLFSPHHDNAPILHLFIVDFGLVISTCKTAWDPLLCHSLFNRPLKHSSTLSPLEGGQVHQKPLQLQYINKLQVLLYVEITKSYTM